MKAFAPLMRGILLSLTLSVQAIAAPVSLYNTTCPTQGITSTADATANNMICNGSDLWQYPAYIVGATGIGGTAAACTSTGGGMLEYTSNNLYFCNATAFTQLQAVQSTPVVTAPSGSGYFVMTGTQWNGSLGGRTGADALCLTELSSTNTGWQGYSTANSRGQLVSSKVHAFVCDTTTCNNLVPLTTYYFANAGNSSAGGAYFTTDSNGDGPQDSAFWTAANYFSGTYNYWSGRNSGSATVWAAAPSTLTGNCTNYTGGTSSANGTIGISGSGSSQRWYTALATACNSTLNLICFVNP